MPTILGEISKSSPLGVATMKLTRMTSTDTLTMKHVELPGSPPHSLKEKEIPVNTINKPISNLNPTPPPLLSEGKSMTSFKDRNTSFISIPDTILSSVSNKLDAEALAWKEVPSILRSTIKQILLVLREHGQVIEQTLPKLPTSHSEDVSSVLKELKTKVDILETQRQEDRTYFEQRLQEQSIKHQLQLQAKETLWMQRMDEVLQQQQKHTTSVEIDRSLVDPENHLKWEVLSERVKELEVRLFGGHRKASQKSFFEIPFPFTSTHFKPTTDSVQVLPGSIKSVRDEETQDPNEKLPELTDRLDHLYHQLSILEGKCQTNEDAWKVLQLQLKQENRHLNLNSEEAQMSKNPSLKLSLSSKHIQSTIQTELPNLHHRIDGLQSDLERTQALLERQITGISKKHFDHLNQLDLVSNQTLDVILASLKEHWTQQWGLKLDITTLEALVPQFVTRESMKKYFQKHLQRLSTTSSSSLSSTTLISMKPWKDLTSLVYYLETQVRQLQTETQAWQVRWQSQGLESNPSMTFNSKPHQDWEGWKQSWTRDMDEKLYLMASEVRDLKSICSEKSLSHPTYMTQLSKLPKWSIVVWNTKTLKQGSAIVWTETGQGDSEVCQVDPEHPHLIKVPTEGIYFLSFAIFTSLKPSIQVVVNGQSIVSAIHSPTYTVHHENSSTSSSSKSKKGNTASSISWMDYVNIPSRSKLSLHWHGGKLDSKVHGFLYLQKMV